MTTAASKPASPAATLVIVGLVAGAAICQHSLTTPSQPEQPVPVTAAYVAPEPVLGPHDLTVRETAIVVLTVQARLKDPNSAKFGKIGWTDFGSAKLVCGVVNAKNAFGVYGGGATFLGSLMGDTFHFWSLNETEDDIRRQKHPCVLAGVLSEDD